MDYQVITFGLSDYVSQEIIDAATQLGVMLSPPHDIESFRDVIAGAGPILGTIIDIRSNPSMMLDAIEAFGALGIPTVIALHRSYERRGTEAYILSQDPAELKTIFQVFWNEDRGIVH